MRPVIANTLDGMYASSASLPDPGLHPGRYLAAYEDGVLKPFFSSGSDWLPMSLGGTVANPVIVKDFTYPAAGDDIVGTTTRHEFGYNSAVGTSFVPVTSDGVYQTPQVAGAKTLRIKAGGNANDTAAGTGAREITLVGLTTTGAEQTVTLATAGASASSATGTSFLRLNRAYVSKSGTYGTLSAGSMAADIVIEAADGSANWATMLLNGYPSCETEGACYTVPLGKTAYVSNISYGVATTKIADLALFRRDNVLETATPYTAVRIVQRFAGVVESGSIPLPIPWMFPALTDFGFMGKVSTGTGSITMSFDILLVDD